MPEILATLTLLAAAAGFVQAAWSDFREWRIPNITVLLLIIAYAAYAYFVTLIGPGWPLPVDIASGLAAGALLIVTGFVLWLVKMLGAGDAKLMYPIGLFVGWDDLLSFAIYLIVMGILVTFLLKLPLPGTLSATWTGMRLNEIRNTRQVPYGVLLVVSLFALYAVKFAF